MGGRGQSPFSPSKKPLNFQYKINLFNVLFSGVTDYDKEIRRLVLGYMNGIQALYMLPSLGQTIKFTIVRLELWERDQINTYQVTTLKLKDKISILTLNRMRGGGAHLYYFAL